MFTVANIEWLPSASIKSWCETWLQAKSIEAEESTHDRYKRIVERFTSFLGETKSKRLLAILVLALSLSSTKRMAFVIIRKIRCKAGNPTGDTSGIGSLGQ